MEAALEKIASLLQAAPRRSLTMGQLVGLVGAALLISLLFATEFEIIDRWPAGDAVYVLARAFEALTLAALLGLGFATVLACRDSDRIRDHERRLRAEAALHARRHRATHDELTDLPNERAVVDCLNETLRSTPEAKLALYLLDLDGFASVNMAYGSPTGDAILRVVASRLKSVVRRDDLVARVDGDAFAVVIRDAASRDEAMEIGQRYAMALDEPIWIEDRSHPIGATVGLAYYPEDGATPEELLLCADFAARTERSRQRTETVFLVALTGAPAV